MSQGYIYILQNPEFPQLLKIGKTTLTPEKRAAEVSSTTGVPRPYAVVSAWRVTDCHTTERIVHSTLNEFRPNKNREFFQITPEEANSRISAICQSRMSSTCQSQNSVCGITRVAPVRSAYDSASDVNRPSGKFVRSARAVIRRRFKKTANTYFYQDIPAHKLRNVRARYSALLQPDDEVLLIYDGTWMGGAENGFILTNRGIGCAFNDGPPSFFRYENIKLDEICIGFWTKGFYIQGETRAEVWSSEKDSVLVALKTAVIEIKSRLRP